MKWNELKVFWRFVNELENTISGLSDIISRFNINNKIGIQSFASIFKTKKKPRLTFIFLIPFKKRFLYSRCRCRRDIQRIAKPVGPTLSSNQKRVRQGRHARQPRSCDARGGRDVRAARPEVALWRVVGCKEVETGADSAAENVWPEGGRGEEIIFKILRGTGGR